MSFVLLCEKLLPVRRLHQPLVAAMLAVAAGVPSARAVTCSTESQMTAAQRDPIVQAVRALGTDIQSANVSAVRQATISAVAAQFDPIAASIQTLAPQVQGAALTINAIYALKASDLKSTQEETQFFCSVPGS